MYKCDLNIHSFNRYLNELLDKGMLVKVRHESRHIVLYKTSEKGKKLFKAFDEVASFYQADLFPILARKLHSELNFIVPSSSLYKRIFSRAKN